MHRLLLAAALAIAAVAPAAAQSLGWSTYVNPRFGYAVEVPAAFLLPGAQSDNGDGQSFATRDGTAFLSVWGSGNALGWSLDDYYRAALTRSGIGVVTYQRKTGDWYVLSGYRTVEGVPGPYEAIFYERVEMTADGGAISGILILNAPSLRERMEPIIARISRTLTPPRRGG